MTSSIAPPVHAAIAGFVLLLGCAAGRRDAATEAAGRAADRAADAAPTTAADSRPARRPACPLVTKAEVESILGVAVAAPEESDDGDEAKCAYMVNGGVSSVAIDVNWTAGEAGWQGAKLGTRIMDHEAAGAGAQVSEPVAGLGDEAIVESATMPTVRMPDIQIPGGDSLGIPGGKIGGTLGGGESALWVRKGDVLLNVNVAMQENAKAKAIAIARAALKRL